MEKVDELILASDLDALPEIHDFCDKLRNSLGLSEYLHGNILLVLTEAATNAIVHGNNSDPEKSVVITTYADSDSVVFQVSDEGTGFDSSKLPDPLSDENLLKEGGRGVFLIEQFSDHVAYQNHGSTIIITFNLTGA